LSIYEEEIPLFLLKNNAAALRLYFQTTDKLGPYNKLKIFITNNTALNVVYTECVPYVRIKGLLGKHKFRLIK
jgi:hypothetical protein